jgi:hypothetical protein
MLQYLNEVDTDLESARISSDVGRDLFAYAVAARRAVGGE